MMDVSGAQPSCIQHRNAHIKFNEDGSASLILTAYDMGQNLPGTCAQIAAEVLGIGYEDIHVVTGTRTAPCSTRASGPAPVSTR